MILDATPSRSAVLPGPLPLVLLPGQGEVHCALVHGQSAVVRSAGAAPLKLLVPRARGQTSLACATTFGGGLVAGDRLQLHVEVAAGASLVLSTQASTKVYRSHAGLPASQELTCCVAPQATLALLPDPVTCFTGACYQQRTAIEVQTDANLLLVDALTAGRMARGESWAFTRYHSLTTIRVGTRTCWRDRVVMEGGPDLARRMGRFQALATLLLLGPRFSQCARELGTHIATLPVPRRSALLLGASPVGDGLLVRLGATTQAQLHQTLRTLLAPAFALVGGDPWDRRA